MMNKGLHGFFLAIGKQGSGKTLFTTKLAIDNKEGRRIFSNYTLYGVEFQKITLGNEDEERRGSIDILKALDDDPHYFDNSIMLLDEIHVYLDSLDFMRKNNRRLHTFFSQLRKRNILLLGTTQYIMNVDIRIRRQCMNVFEMKKLTDNELKALIKENAIDPADYTRLKGNLYNVTTHEIDGYYTDYVSEYHVNLSEYYKYYDTTEIIL